MPQLPGCDGERDGFTLEPMSVAEFYRRIMDELRALDFDIRINMMPNEIADAVRFDEDTVHASYDKAYVERFFRALLQANRLCKEFRAPFLGKASPVHFFGAASIWRSHASRDALRRRIPAAFRICPTGLRAKPTIAKSIASAFGRVDRDRGVVLRVRLSRAAGLFASAGRPAGILDGSAARVSASVRERAHVGRSGSHGARFLQLDIRGGSKSREMGPRVIGTGLEKRHVGI